VLLIVADGSPPSMRSISLIVQHLIDDGSTWLIERRSVHPVGADPGTTLLPDARERSHFS
jgi:hypothetical protein